MSSSDGLNDSSARPLDPFLCAICQKYLPKMNKEDPKNCHDDVSKNDNTVSTSPCIQTVCQICGNLWIDDNPIQQESLERAIQQACLPYGGLSVSSKNHVTFPITITIAGNVKKRLCHFVQQAQEQEQQQQQQNSDSSSSSSQNHHPNKKKYLEDISSLYLQDLKRHLQREAEQKIHQLLKRPSNNSNDSDNDNQDPRHPTDVDYDQQDMKDDDDDEVNSPKSPPKKDTRTSSSSSSSSSTPINTTTIPQMIHTEKQGYLSIHILCIPSKRSDSTSFAAHSGETTSSSSSRNEKKRKRRHQHNNKKSPPPHFHLGGNVSIDDTNMGGSSNGGDPKILLEERLRSQGYQWLSWSEVESSSSSMTMTTNNRNQRGFTTTTTTSQLLPPPPTTWILPMEFHIAVVRTPIYFYGYYTKSLRTVSQTPFIVEEQSSHTNDEVQQQKEQQQRSLNENDDNDNDDNDKDHGTSTTTTTTATKKNKKTMVTLGTTSVEEQICIPIIRKYGISRQNTNNPSIHSSTTTAHHNNNNERDNTDDHDSNNNMGDHDDTPVVGPNDTKIYGMCKFHASGREDMDVRMILRPSSSSSSSSSIGRPFCVQLIDALRPVTSQEELQQIVREINHEETTTANGDDEDRTTSPLSSSSLLSLSSDLWYGRNPMGVGISNNFQIVPASSFSNLQADTESKIKHYGCHCWSQRELPPDWTFSLSTIINNNNNNKVEMDTDNNNNTIKDTEQSLPLTIHQATPLRVLHRRANLIRERQIYNLYAIRIDEHHFRLELSTQAGTYVKEFVHGDLGRTIPSMASLLQTKTNLLLLDCEGIEMGK